MHPVQVNLTQFPIRYICRSLGGIGATVKSRENAENRFRAAPTVEVEEHRLTDELSIQPDGKLDYQTVTEIPLRYIKETPLRHRSVQTALASP